MKKIFGTMLLILALCSLGMAQSSTSTSGAVVNNAPTIVGASAQNTAGAVAAANPSQTVSVGVGSVSNPTVTNGATANPTQTITQSPNQSTSINQTFAAADAGQGRWFVNPAQPFEAPVLPYFGPWNTGANILDDLRTMPTNISDRMAKAMYNGGVSWRISYLYDPPGHPYQCKLLFSLPSMPLMVDGKQAVNAKGELLYVLDEAKFTKAAYIFLQGDKKATTVDLIAMAAHLALKMGANGIFIIKAVTLTSVSSSGWGVGAGSVGGFLDGPGLSKAQSYSAGTGFNRASTKPLYRAGMVVLAVRE